MTRFLPGTAKNRGSQWAAAAVLYSPDFPGTPYGSPLA